MEAATTDVEVGETTRLLDPEEKPLEDIEKNTKAEKVVAGFSLVAFSSSVAAMIFTSSVMVTSKLKFDLVEKSDDPVLTLSFF